MPLIPGKFLYKGIVADFSAILLATLKISRISSIFIPLSDNNIFFACSSMGPIIPYQVALVTQF